MAETAVDIRKKELAKNAWQMLEQMKPSIAEVLPQHIKPERMAMIAFTAMRKTPKLLECSRESLIGSIMTASMLGLEPSGPIGHGALIPYWNSRRAGGAGYECQFQPMYQGILDLARRSGFVKDVQVRAVRKGDTYSFRYGLDPDIQHVPLQGAGAEDPNREPIAVYAIIRLTSGGVQWDQMSYAEALAHGKRYSPSWDAQTKAFKPGSVWADNPLAMCLKTVLKVTLKLCPKSPELAAAIRLDDFSDVGKVSTLRKLGDGVFDVDLGEMPEEEQRQSTKALDAIVEKETRKEPGPLANHPGSVDYQPQTPRPDPQQAPLTEQLEQSVDALKECSIADFTEIEMLAKDCGVSLKEVKDHVINTMGFPVYGALTRGRKVEVVKWIRAQKRS